MATFAEEFKKQRAMKGSGKTFEYKGKTYSTDTADGKKAGPAKPAARPANLNPKSGASRSTDGKVKPKSEGLGSRIMKASAAAGKFLGEKAVDIAKYGQDEPAPRVGTTTNYKAGGVVKKMGGGSMGYAAGGKMDMVEKGGKKVPSFAADGVGKMAMGGVVKMKEGSAKDMREDKAMAKKSGMTMKQHEASAADKKHDAGKKMMSGGVMKKATGGSMRGTGAAIRGKGFSGCK